MSTTEELREEVLDKVYDRLLEYNGLDEFFGEGAWTYASDGKKVPKQHPAIQLIIALENARNADRVADARERELEIKQSELNFRLRELDLKSEEIELKKKEFELRDNQALVDNAARDMDRTNIVKVELLKALTTVGVQVITTAIWGTLFTHELRATRVFEIEGTETSAAGRWLKNSFPKPRVF